MAAKQPKDHKQPKDKPRDVTVHGVAITIDPEVFDDLDMVEYLYDLRHADTEGGNGGMSIVPFLRKLCGDSYRDVKDALRDPNTGRIDMETLNGFIEELMGQLSPNS